MSAKIQLSFGVRQYAIADGCTFMDYVAVGIYNICIFGVGGNDERTEFAASYVRKVAVVVREKSRFLCEVNRASALPYSITD